MELNSGPADDFVDLKRMNTELGEGFFHPLQLENAFRAEIPEGVSEQAAEMFRGMTLNEAVEFYSMRTYRLGGVHEAAAIRQIARFFPKKLN